MSLPLCIASVTGGAERLKRNRQVKSPVVNKMLKSMKHDVTSVKRLCLYGAGQNLQGDCAEQQKSAGYLQQKGNDASNHIICDRNSGIENEDAMLRTNLEKKLQDSCMTTSSSAFMEGGAGAATGTSRSRLTGRWRKVKERSDSMQEACDMVQLPWVFRKALRFLNVLQVHDGTDTFVTILKAGGVMDVVEEYPWNGEEVVHGRRDKRRGCHHGKVILTDEGHPQITVWWEDPFAGVCNDTFILSHDGTELKQVTEMEVYCSQPSTTKYITVYQRV